MKAKIILIIFFAMNIFSLAKVGETAPNFSLINQDNKKISLEEFRGKKVVLEWTNHECPFVKRHYKTGNMQKLQKELVDNDVIWLSIVSSAKGKQGYIDQDQAKQLTLTRDASPNHVLLDEDGSVGKKFVAKTTPHMYVIDEDGILKYQGAIDNLGTMGALFSTDLSQGVNFVREAIQSLNAGLEIESSSTRPYGCSIKY
jgi:peroxiredoxin